MTVPALAVTETFRTNTLTNAWQFTGAASTTPSDVGPYVTSGLPCLTVAGNTSNYSCTTTSPSFPDATEYQDASGEGWLRLTTPAYFEHSDALLIQPFLLANGFDLTFTYAMYGGNSTPADGLSVFLIDPTQPNAGTGGLFGGGLGYCDIAGGILGIGLDAFGNFTSPTACGTGPGQQTSNISVLAGYAAPTPWNYLGGTGVMATSTLRTDSGWAYPAGGTCTGGSCVRTGQQMHISFYPDTTCGTGQYRILVESITNGTTVLNLCADTTLLGALPTNVELGFAASTGGSYQYAEIRDITAAQVSDLSITNTDGRTAYVPGPVSYTLVVANNGPTSADGVLLADPAVTGLTVTSIACTATAGGAVCPAAASLTVAALQGTGIAIPTFPTGSSLTFTVSATVAAGTTGNLSNAASIAPPSGGIATSTGISCAAAGGVFDATTKLCTATDTDTDALSDQPLPVPVLRDALMAVLGMMLAGLGIAGLRRHAQMSGR